MRSRPILAASAITLSFMVAIPALADPTPAEGENIPIAILEDSEMSSVDTEFDATDIAERAQEHNRILAALEDHIEGNPETYSTTILNADGTSDVHFTASLDSFTEEQVSAIPGVTTHNDAVYTALQADQVNEEVFTIAVDAMEADTTATSVVDPVKGEVKISVQNIEDAQSIASEPAEISSQARRQVQSNNSTHDIQSPTIVIEVDSSLEVNDAAINGGDRITFVNSTASTVCTVGFPARYGSLQGITTARHCPDNISVDGGYKLNQSTSLRRMAVSQGDAKWHRKITSETVNPRFRHAWGSYRPVWAHPNIGVGLDVCRFGAVSGNGSRCATVRYVSSCVTTESGTWCGVAMTNRTTGMRKGDSGGPWFYGNNAYGLSKGFGTRDGTSVEWFTHSRKANSAMGLTPMINR